MREARLGARESARVSGNREAVFAQEPRLGAVLLRNPRPLPRAYLATPLCVPASLRERLRTNSNAS